MSPSVLPRLSRERLWLIFLLLFASLNGLLWSFSIPFDGAPDEVHKYEVVHFIWKNHRVPTFGPAADVYIRQAPGTRNGYVYGIAATSPCGAHFLSALLMCLTFSNAPEVLLHAARLSSVIYTVAALCFAHGIVRALFGSTVYALGVTALIMLIPQFTYTGAYVGDDAFQIMAVTWGIWATAVGVQEGWTLRNRLIMGLALALVSTGKQNGWAAVFPFVLFALSSAWRGRWREGLRAWVSMLLPAGLVLGSWFARNWILYGDPLALGIARSAWQDFVTRLGLEWDPLVQQRYGFLDLFVRTRWLRMTFESFWGRFFYMNVPMDPRIYLVLLGGSACGAAATLWVLFRERGKALPTSLSAKILGCAGVAFVLLFTASATTSLYNDYQAQGRYFFPLIVPIAIFLTLGAYVLSRSYLKQPPVGLWAAALILLFALNIFSLVHYIRGHPYPEIPLPASVPVSSVMTLYQRR